MKKGWYTSSIFLKLIEEENNLEEILAFVKENPRYIEEYDEKLVKPFKEDVIKIYKKYIHSTAKTSSNRRGYQGVCQIIKRYKKIAGKPKKEEVINELMGLYKKGPAFIDELFHFKIKKVQLCESPSDKGEPKRQGRVRSRITFGQGRAKKQGRVRNRVTFGQGRPKKASSCPKTCELRTRKS